MVKMGKEKLNHPRLEVIFGMNHGGEGSQQNYEKYERLNITKGFVINK